MVTISKTTLETLIKSSKAYELIKICFFIVVITNSAETVATAFFPRCIDTFGVCSLKQGNILDRCGKMCF